MSNLTVTYVSPPPAAAPVAASAGATLTDAVADPLGFLGALLQQLAPTPQPAGTEEAAPEAAEAAASATPPMSAMPIVGGPASDAIIDPADAIIDIAEPDKSETDTNTETDTTPDPLAADPAATLADIVRILLGRPAGEAPPPEAVPRQQAIVALLDSLGIDPQPAAPLTAPSAPTADVPDDLLRLSTQLSRVGAALAERQPDLAARLETLATSLVAGDADPDLLTRLARAATAPNPTALEALVDTLAAPRPAPTLAPQAPTPSLAAGVTLDIPDPLRAPAPAPAPPPAESAPRPAPIAKAEVRADRDSDAPADPQKSAASPPRAEPPPTQPSTPPATPVAARALPAAYQAPAQPINMGQVAFELVRQVQQGVSRFTIRLDPPELGRVDVKLQVDASGGVSARLSVDRAETLDLFQRDQRTLERALAQAGLDPARTSLEFSLRQNPGNPGGQPQQQQHDRFGPGPATRPETGVEANAAPAITLYRGTAGPAGVNLFV